MSVPPEEVIHVALDAGSVRGLKPLLLPCLFPASNTCPGAMTHSGDILALLNASRRAPGNVTAKTD